MSYGNKYPLYDESQRSNFSRHKRVYWDLSPNTTKVEEINLGLENTDTSDLLNLLFGFLRKELSFYDNRLFGKNSFAQYFVESLQKTKERVEISISAYLVLRHCSLVHI